MKFARIAQICKKYPYITIRRTAQAQWIDIGAAAYAAYGTPEIKEAGELISLIDVPEEKRNGFQVSFDTDGEDGILSDTVYGEIALEDMGVSIMWRGMTLRPLMTPQGHAYWLNECYLYPVDDEKELTYWLRETAKGMYTVAIKAGFAIKALIGVRIASPDIEETLQEVLHGCARSGERGYRVPRAVIEEHKGYQLPATVHSVMAWERDTEEAEQVEIDDEK